MAPIALVGFPALNAFTGSSLETRFANTSTTNRTTIANADLQVFMSSPVFGVGVGVAVEERSNAAGFATPTRAHTEFSRLLAEHGALGLVASCLLLTMAIHRIRATASQWNKIVAVGCATWALVTMAHSVTAVAAVSITFGLSQLRVSRSTTPVRRSSVMSTSHGHDAEQDLHRSEPALG